MTAFQDLLRYEVSVDPGEAQRRAADLLPTRVAASPMQWWTPGDPVPSAGRWLLIGVAVWSGHDLRLLDQVSDWLTDPRCNGPKVAVFDAGAGRPHDQFEDILPGIGSVHHSPAVGYWVDGVLRETACGYLGRQIVARALSMDEALIQPPTRAAL
jgi:hypothetical protein